MKLTDLQRENRVMMAQADLFKLAEKEKGSQLTPMDEWFVWVHPSMTFSEIRVMLDSTDLGPQVARAKAIEDEKNPSDWPQFG